MFQIDLNDKPYGGPNVKDYKWIVTWYESGYYEGSGEAVGFTGTELHLYNLGHCSCYGPFDAGYDSISVEGFLHNENALVFDIKYSVLHDKVVELLEQERNNG